MTRKKTTTAPGDWTANLADFDHDEAAYAAALQAHLQAKGEPSSDTTDDGSDES
jgi:hypothetical protein